jgi:hypothetical protein
MKGHESSRDPTAAVALNNFMSELSEKYWCAAWLRGLEIGLWKVREGQQGTFAADGKEADEWTGDLPPEDVARLRTLSDQCGGWWGWSEEDGDEVFVPLDEWRASIRGRTPHPSGGK